MARDQQTVMTAERSFEIERISKQIAIIMSDGRERTWGDLDRAIEGETTFIKGAIKSMLLAKTLSRTYQGHEAIYRCPTETT
jgi:hypothetical protein